MINTYNSTFVADNNYVRKLEVSVASMLMWDFNPLTSSKYLPILLDLIKLEEWKNKLIKNQWGNICELALTSIF